MQDFLGPAEKILCAGAPPARVLFDQKDFIAIPFALIWSPYAAWMAWKAAIAGGHIPVFFMILAAVGGLTLLPGRLPLDTIGRSRAAYALTDRRLHIVSKFPFHKAVSLPLEKTRSGVHPLSKTDQPLSDLAVDPRFLPKRYLPVVIVDFSLSLPLPLEAIPDAKHVQEKILSPQDAAKQGA